MTRSAIVGVAVVAATVAVGLSVTGGGGGETCTTTISSGSSVSTALTNVTAGGTVCLNAGSYTFAGPISKASLTKVTPANGVTQAQVTFSTIDLDASNNVWFNGMTSSGGSTGNSGAGATNSRLTNIRFTDTVCIWSRTANSNLLIDGNMFDSLGPGGCSSEGGVGVRGPNTGSNGITISNNDFDGSSGDAIQLTQGSSGTVIGPGNWFHNTVAEGGAHADAIQPYGASNITITKNWFGPNNDGGYSDFDCNGSEGLVFTDNVMQRNASAQTPFAVTKSDGAVVTGNTFGNNTPVSFDNGNTPGAGNDCDGVGPTGLVIRDNIFNGGCFIAEAVSPTFDHNVSTDNCIGTGGASGSATFTGGTTPSTFAGYVLTGASLGFGTASDGQNIGAPVATMTGAWD